MRVFIIHFGERAQQGGKKQDSEKPRPSSAVTWAEFLNLPEHLLLQLNEADATYVTTLEIKCTNSAHCLAERKLSVVVIVLHFMEVKGLFPLSGLWGPQASCSPQFCIFNSAGHPPTDEDLDFPSASKPWHLIQKFPALSKQMFGKAKFSVMRRHFQEAVSQNTLRIKDGTACTSEI